MSIDHPEAGDRFIWKDSVILEILRVNDSSAEILCFDGTGVWRKRQPLPLPAGTRPFSSL